MSDSLTVPSADALREKFAATYDEDWDGEDDVLESIREEVDEMLRAGQYGTQGAVDEACLDSMYVEMYGEDPDDDDD